MVVVIVVFAIVFVMLLKLTGKTRQERVLDAVPGPTGYPLVGNFFDVVQTSENYLDICEKNQSKYGSVYKTWIGSTPVVHLSKASFVEVVLGTKGVTRSPSSNSFVTRSLKQHPFLSMRNRSIMASVLCSIQPDCVIQMAREHCTGSDVTLCVLDVMCELILGVNVNAQRGENASFVTSILQLRKLFRQNHKVRYYSDTLFRMTTHGKEQSRHVAVVAKFINDAIARVKSRVEQRRRKSPTPAACLLEDLLAFDGVYSASDIQSEVLNLMSSALDCVDQAIKAVLRVLAVNHPVVQDKILREARTTPEGFNIKDLQRMTYFDRVIKEALRLHPPCPLIVKELERDVRLGNYLIPHSTTICINVWRLHRDPESFPDPETFDPDNFLPKRLDKRSRFSYIPFGILDCHCLGQKLTEIIQRTILLTLIKKFKIVAISEGNDDDASNAQLQFLPMTQTE